MGLNVKIRQTIQNLRENLPAELSALTIVWAYVPNNYRKRAEAEDILDVLKKV